MGDEINYNERNFEKPSSSINRRKQSPKLLPEYRFVYARAKRRKKHPLSYENNNKALEEKNTCNSLKGTESYPKKQEFFHSSKNNQEVVHEKSYGSYLQAKPKKRKRKRKKRKKHAMPPMNSSEASEATKPSSMLECLDTKLNNNTHVVSSKKNLDVDMEKTRESTSQRAKSVMTEKKRKQHGVSSKRSSITENEITEIQVEADTVNKKKRLGDAIISPVQTNIKSLMDEHLDTQLQTPEMDSTKNKKKHRDHSGKINNNKQKEEQENLEISSTACLKGKSDSSLPKNMEVFENESSLVSINKKDKPSEEVCMPLEGSIIKPTKRRLLVLDLNGLLADIGWVRFPGDREHMKLGGKTVFKRPFSDEFLRFCFEKFDVGIWSSATLRNVQAVVNFLMRDMKSRLLFCWDRSKCTVTAFNTIENKHKPLVLKELIKIWDKDELDLPWEKGDYAPSNTLLLDDSPYKALANPPHTAIFPYPYRFEEEGDNALGPGGDLRVYLERLAMADDVQQYVGEHPFGQPAITSSHPHWNFYFNISSQYQERAGQYLSSV